LHASSGEVQFQVQNINSGEAIYFNATAGHDPEKEWKDRNGGVMQFECSDTGCALKQLWTNRGYPAYEFRTPKTAERKLTHLAIVRAAVK
jgi:hypothetical protein